MWRKILSWDILHENDFSFDRLVNDGFGMDDSIKSEIKGNEEVFSEELDIYKSESDFGPFREIEVGFKREEYGSLGTYATCKRHALHLTGRYGWENEEIVWEDDSYDYGETTFTGAAWDWNSEEKVIEWRRLNNLG